MNIELKSAWYTVVVIAVALVACLLVAALMGAGPAFGPLGLLGLLGLTPVLFRKRKGMVDCDERDLEVAKKATLVGGVWSYLAVVVGGMSIWFVQYFRGEAQISVHLLPLLVGVAAMVLYLARSIFIISQYSRKALGIDE
jgi:hypothetical protein